MARPFSARSRTCRSPAISATSRPLCSDRPASTPGEAKNTYGTGCFMLMNTGEKLVPSNSGLLTTLGLQDRRPRRRSTRWKAAIAITGALVQWLRDNLGLIEKSSRHRAAGPHGQGQWRRLLRAGFLRPLCALLERQRARGVIAGLTRFVNKGHIARAVLEATAFQVREVLEAMEKDSGIELANLRTDGGMVSNHLLMQFQSDILNKPVVRPVIQETTALGLLTPPVWRSDSQGHRRTGRQLGRRSSLESHHGRSRSEHPVPLLEESGYADLRLG